MVSWVWQKRNWTRYIPINSRYKLALSPGQTQRSKWFSDDGQTRWPAACVADAIVSASKVLAEELQSRAENGLLTIPCVIFYRNFWKDTIMRTWLFVQEWESVTSEHDWQLKFRAGQVAILTRNYSLPGRYFEPYKPMQLVDTAVKIERPGVENCLMQLLVV